MKKLKVLSLFDGMSCGQIALRELGFEEHQYEYYASEVDENAIKVTQTNFPKTVQVGDVSKLRFQDGVLYTEKGSFNVGGFDLLLGGSPCTNLSMIGNRVGMATSKAEDVTTLAQYLSMKEQGVGFEGQSYLFWEYIRLRDEVKPSAFLLENVKMSKKWKDIFDNIVDGYSNLIDSALVSAQSRLRNYWTSFPIVAPADRNIMLSDVVDTSIQMRDIIPTFKGAWGGVSRLEKGVNCLSNAKLRCLTTKLSHTTQYLFNADYTAMRLLTLDEARLAQTVPDWYKHNSISKTAFEKCLGNGWTIEVIKHILKQAPIIQQYIEGTK